MLEILTNKVRIYSSPYNKPWLCHYLKYFSLIQSDVAEIRWYIPGWPGFPHENPAETNPINTHLPSACCT